MTGNSPDNPVTSTDNPVATVLEKAAKGMREAASAATEGPWWSDESDACWRLHGVHDRIPPQKHSDGTVLIPEQVLNHQILKAPKAGTTGFAEYWPEPADGLWITRMHPGVGLALAGLLGRQADQARHGFSLSPVCLHRHDGDCECERVWWCEWCGYQWRTGLCTCWKEALDVATAWLGEEAPGAH